MAQSEFSLIEKYFSDTGNSRFPARLSQGDDAAIVAVPPGMQAVMSIDTLIAGVHFPLQTAAADVACKALAVNLSDLAAMGATPAWFLLSISLPEFDEAWLDEFSQSLKRDAERYQIELIGGDTCRGPLSITIQVTGLVASECFTSRAGAKPGDIIVVSGRLGDAALGLAHLQQKIELPEQLQDCCLNALNRPTPRLQLAEFVSLYASAAIDISDGLVGDLRHILQKSGVGARVQQALLPVNDWIRDQQAFSYALIGGDDYELCLTLPREYRDQMDAWNQAHADCLLSEIGEITESGYTLEQGKVSVDLNESLGYQHFG